MPRARGVRKPLEEESTELVVLPPQRWKPGQTGNPRGGPSGARRRLFEDFLEDMHDSWKVYGRAALMTAALTDPVAYVRVAASLMPKEIEATINVVHADRMSNDELAAIACQGGEDLMATEEDEEILQPVG